MDSYRRFKLAVLLFALAGTIFSGYLTYYNYWGGGCENALITCGTGPNAVLIFGQPSCVYGFFMFLAVAVIVSLGWMKQNIHPFASTIFWLSIAGTLFAGGLTVYELVWLKTGVYGIPACAYGLLFYLGIFVSAYLWRTRLAAAPVMPTATPPATPPTM